MFSGKRLNFVVVQQAVLLAHTVLDGIVDFAGLVWLCAVGQVAARVQRHAKNGITRFDQRLKHTLVCLRTRVRLHVRKVTSEQLFGPINREVFSNINVLAPAVVATAWVSFGVFIRHHTALGLHDGGRYDVFRRDQFDLFTLTAKLCGNGGGDFWVTSGQAFGEKTVVFDTCIHGRDFLFKPLDAT